MSLCFLSLESSKVFNKLIYKNIKEAGFDGLSEALIVIFPYIEVSEKSTTAQLSKQLGYSRQAMHKHIKKLDELGYITLALENQKEKIIQLTQKGQELIAIANRSIIEIESKLSALIGKEELDVYKKNQIKIYDCLESLN